MSTTSRDDQIWQGVAAALTATNQFDAVIVSKLPEETAFPISGQSVAYIAPGSYAEESRHYDASGPTYRRTVRYGLTIAVRSGDKVARDAIASQLADVAQDALTGVSLGPNTIPAWNMCKAGRFETPNTNERRVILMGEVSVLVVGYGGRDTGS